MKERILFPEEFIPQVVAVIRRGLKEETNQEVIDGLTEQIENLEDGRTARHCVVSHPSGNS